jgi:hypothetical protein
VFLGSATLSPTGPLVRYYEEARELARLVTTWSKSLPRTAIAESFALAAEVAS